MKANMKTLNHKAQEKHMVFSGLPLLVQNHISWGNGNPGLCVLSVLHPRQSLHVTKWKKRTPSS